MVQQASLDAGSFCVFEKTKIKILQNEVMPPKKDSWGVSLSIPDS